MANKTKSYPSSKKKFKWGAFWTGLTVFVLVVASIFTFFCVGTMGLRDWSFSRVFPKKSTEPSTEQGGGAVLGEGESNGISLMSMAIPAAEYETYGVDRAAQNAYKLSVSYIPENTTYQSTTFTASWKDASVTSNVNNYVTLSQTTSGSKEATLTILKGFTTQIIVKAANTKYSDIFATTTVDWLCDSLSFNFQTSHPLDLDDDYCASYCNWSGGTVIPDTAAALEIIFEIPSLTLYMKNNGYSNVHDTASFMFDTADLSWGEGMVTMRNVISKLCSNLSQDYWNAVCSHFGTYGSGDCWGSYTYRYHRYYKGQYIGSSDICEGGDLELDDYSAFEIKATGIDVNESQIVAWSV